MQNPFQRTHFKGILLNHNSDFSFNFRNRLHFLQKMFMWHDYPSVECVILTKFWLDSGGVLIKHETSSRL